MRVSRPLFAALALSVLAAALIYNVKAAPLAQDLTATPALVDVNAAAPAAQGFGPTLTPTRTPTPLAPVQIEALQLANVRGGPDTDAELLGQIQPGEYYNVLRRYFRWIEFQYDRAPSRRGWVFDELVRIIGDESAIVSVESLDATLEGAPDLNATATAEAITQTPGGLLTATAQGRVSTAVPGQIGVVTPGAGILGGSPELAQALPTFTYPPGMIALAPTQAPAANATATEPVLRTVSSGPTQIAPLVPIVILGGLGLLGLLIGSIRR